MISFKYFVVGLVVFFFSCNQSGKNNQEPIQISGIYPHLAYYNNEGECGTGAVVPWADRLWVITYGPHLPAGSSDKLYEITTELQQYSHQQSIGGTPANRMIHTESKQLFIGPYAIDDSRNVRVIPYNKMHGRHTGNARHLTDPIGKIYFGTMEEGFYEVDVQSLEVKSLYLDGNLSQKDYESAHEGNLLLGAHGKGLYSSQGVMVYSNNGERSELALKQFDIESGVLAEWNGIDWTVIRRNQFVEVTGPGGIYGNPNPETDPIWVTGWDHKSVLVGVRDQGKWSFYRLPKASHSYDGAHGWNTEWPRIRNIGTTEDPDYLMTMHGMFWRFPNRFSRRNSAGIRPRSSYLKVIGDFARWNNQLVFGCDDSAKKEFLNKRKVKGNIEGPGQSNSNLWFTSLEKPGQLGPITASGAVWLSEEVEANSQSEPFLFAGWPKRSVWIGNHGTVNTNISFYVDRKGDSNWSPLRTEILKSGESKLIEFSSEEIGEWVRVSSSEASKLTVEYLFTAEEDRKTEPGDIFQGITKANDEVELGGLLYGLGDNRRALGISTTIKGKGSSYYELDGELNLVPKDDAEMQQFINEKFAIPKDVVLVEKGSVLIVDDTGRRWRLPLGESDNHTTFIEDAQVRICREVATERDLFNCHGTFYELPAENADGFAKIRPITSHNFRIHDYASYRGLLVMTGINPEEAKNNEHIITSSDHQASVWVGTIDDLWEMGKPTGQGGPWKNSSVQADEASDPYLIGFYDEKQLNLSHDLWEEVIFNIEVLPIGHGPWMKYKEIVVQSGEKVNFRFPESFQARWIRFRTNKACVATTWLVYD
jgi:hypothetical protein